MVIRYAAVVLMAVMAGVVQQASAAQTAEQRYCYGRVLDPDGKPVPGAKVYVANSSSWTGRKTQEISTAGAEGEFRLVVDGPQVAVHTVTIQAEGHGITCGNVTTDAPFDDADEVRLKPAAELRVRFLDPAGSPAVGLNARPVRIVDRRPMQVGYIPPELDAALLQKTDGKGECVFRGMPQGATIALEIVDDRFAADFAGRNVQIGNGPTTEAVVKLVAAASVDGQVLGEDGAPVQGIRVAAQGTNTNRSGGWAGDITDAQGRYHLKQLYPGEYNIAIDNADFAQLYTARAIEKLTLAPGQGVSGQDLQLITGSIICGKVMAEDTGEPLPGLHVGVYGPAHPRSSGWVQNTTTGPDGSFELRVPPGLQHVYLQSQVPPGFLSLPRQGFRDVTVEDGANIVVDFQLPRNPAPAVSGRVEDADGKPVAGAEVVAELAGRGEITDLRYARGKTDSDGRFSIPGVPDGSRIWAHKRRATTERPTEVGPGQRDLTLAIRVLSPASALVRVRSEDGPALAGAKATLYETQGSFGTSKETMISDAAGVALFKELSPNIGYYVRIAAEGFKDKSVPLTLESGKQAEFEVALPPAKP